MTAVDIWCPPLPPVTHGSSCSRIGLAGIVIEVSAFSPRRSSDDAFVIR